jgi:hypothetical protein
MPWRSQWAACARWISPRTSTRRRSRPALETLEPRRVPTVTYHGGYLLPHVEAQSIFYGALWNTALFKGQSQTLDSFVKYAVQSTFMDGITRAGYAVGEGTDVPGVTIAAPLKNGTRISDAQIQADIQTLISSYRVQPPDPNRLYIFWVQPNVIVTQDGGSSVNDFEGYHGAFNGKGPLGRPWEINYAVLSYPGGTVNNLGEDGMNAIDELTSTAAHELAESATDPGVNSTAWYDDSQNGEIADITQDSYARQDGWEFQLVAAKNDSPIALGGFSTLPKTVTKLVASSASIAAGKSETFTITVAPVKGAGRPTGQLELLNDNVIVATLNLKFVDGIEQATFTTTHLTRGTHTLAAVFNGNAAFREGFSNGVTVTVT